MSSTFFVYFDTYSTYKFIHRHSLRFLSISSPPVSSVKENLPGVPSQELNSCLPYNKLTHYQGATPHPEMTTPHPEMTTPHPTELRCTLIELRRSLTELRRALQKIATP
jgi:hypothetical protein